MEVRLGTKDGQEATVDIVQEAFEQLVDERRPEWESRLAITPGTMGQIEEEVHVAMSHLGDQLIACMLSEATKTSSFEESSSKSWLRRLVRFGRRSIVG